MFGNKKEESPTGKVSGPGLAVNILSTGTEFEGKVKTEGDIRIDGKFTGDLSCKARVIIGPSGYFNGTIQCENAVIEGSFSGKLTVKSMLEVKENGKITGEISTGKLIVQAGAIFDVNCNMGGGAGRKPEQGQSMPTAAKKSVTLDD